MARRRTFTIRFSEDEWASLVELADQEGRSVGQFIRHRLFPPAASQGRLDGDLPATPARDGLAPAARASRPYTKRESAR